MYKIIIANKNQWKKDWQKIPLDIRKTLTSKILELEKNPWPETLSIKKLKSYPTADYRLRIAGYRVLLDRDDEQKKVILYRILHRSKLY